MFARPPPPPPSPSSSSSLVCRLSAPPSSSSTEEGEEEEEEDADDGPSVLREEPMSSSTVDGTTTAVTEREEGVDDDDDDPDRFDFDAIPIDDLSLPDADSAVRIGEACRTAGFFYVVNHGVGADVAEGAMEASRRFFSMDPKSKSRVASNGGRGGRGRRGLPGIFRDRGRGPREQRRHAR